MDTLSYRTVSANNATVDRKWYVVDADGQTLGRISTHIASILRGKNKAYFTPHTDCGDYVIIINAEKIKLSGNKMEEKVIQHYTGYPSGRKVTNPKNVLSRTPEKLLEKSIKGMLPKTTLGAAMYRKLFVYAGPAHPHAAQKPETINF